MVALQTTLAVGEKQPAHMQQKEFSFARAAYAHVPFHPHVGLQRYTLGQLIEGATTASALRDGCDELAAAAEALRVSCGEDTELARGAADLLEHHESRLS